MDKKFSIDDLLSEYNEKLDSLDANAIMEESSREAEQAEADAQESEMLPESEPMMTYDEQPDEQAPQHGDAYFDSQPQGWIPEEEQELIQPVIEDEAELSQYFEQHSTEAYDDTYEAEEDTQSAQVQPDELEGEEYPEGEESDEQQRQERNSRNAAVISNLSRMKRQKAKRGESVSPKNRASLKDLKLGLTGKIIPKTEEIDRSQIPDSSSFEERTEFLSKRRRKKVENFKLDTQDEEIHDRFDGENKGVKHDEFESFEQAPELLADIIELKNTLKRRLTILLVLGGICCLLALANDFGIAAIDFLNRTKSPAVYTVMSVLLGVGAMLESYTVVSAGVKNLVKANADCDSLAAVSMITAMISGVMALFSVSSVGSKYYHLYIGAAIIGLVFNTIGKLMIVNRTESNFRYIAGEYDRYALKTVENEDVAANFTQGSVDDYPVLAKMQKTEFVKDFMKNSYCTDVSDTLAKRITPLILLCGLLLGLLSFVFDKNPTTPVDKILTALAAFAGTVSMCSSMALILVVNLPMTRASRKYLRHSAIMLGYNSVDEFADTNAVLVEAKQLFPTGMVDFVKLKMLSTTSLEECILMAASLSCQADSVLKAPFYKMLRGKTEMLYPVESYIYEDGQGLSGWIENKRVLLGTRELMENHSIEGLPPLSKELEYAGENAVVYLSVSGVVTTLFVVRAMASPSISGWMQELEEEGVVTVIRTVDSFLTKQFICSSFGVDESSVKFLPFRYHKDYDEQTDYVAQVSSSVVCSGHFQSLAMLILGAKRLKAAADLGVAFQFGGVAMGALLCLIMSVTGSFSQISSTAVLGYNMLLVVVALLVQRFKKV